MRPVWLDPVADAVLEATQAPDVDALKGELLREWGSSEVWRLSYGLRSVIVKRGSDAQSGEAEVYERLVVPLGLPAPELIQSARADGAVLLVLADVGRVNLEQEPTIEGFLAAAELLAGMRAKPVEGPSGFTPDRLGDLVERIESMEPELREHLLVKAVPALDDLHRQAPLAVIHGDFVPKNLVTDGTRWTAVDWPLSYCAPHLSDLYTLVRDAVAYGHQSEPIVARYLDAAGADEDLVSRQLTVGGICFVTIALSWIFEEGPRTVPESKDWIGPLLAELADLTEKL
ncbi:phosphotransferase family protein [Kribbella qitaiheensis]|uniref:phosphotransferase family protein n=1 Tax=Kribbella qitaiheensis TaxID=1544730 RepID=UPI00362270F7